MPSVSINAINKKKYARISLGGKRYAFGLNSGSKITHEQQREAARLWLEHSNESSKDVPFKDMIYRKLSTLFWSMLKLGVIKWELSERKKVSR